MAKSSRLNLRSMPNALRRFDGSQDAAFSDPRDLTGWAMLRLESYRRDKCLASASSGRALRPSSDSHPRSALLATLPPQARCGALRSIE